MTWIRIDDTLPTHPKVAGLSDAAFRLYVTALCYAGQHLTDGVVIVAALHRSKPGTVRELLDAHLLKKTERGIEIHDFLEYQSSRAAVLDMRDKKKRAGAAGGKASAESKEAAARSQRAGEPEAEGQADAEADAEAEPKHVLGPLVKHFPTHLPSHPIPSHPREDLSSHSAKGNGNENPPEDEPDDLTDQAIPLEDGEDWYLPFTLLEELEEIIPVDVLDAQLEMLAASLKRDPSRRPKRANAARLVRSWMNSQVTKKARVEHARKRREEKAERERGEAWLAAHPNRGAR